MTFNPPTRNQQRQRCADTVAAFNALPDKSTFNLIDWFFDVGPGAAETDRSLTNMATYYGRPSEEFRSFNWKSRATPELARIDDFAITAGLYDENDDVVWNQVKWQIVMDRLAELV